jgi:F0F1-type ATP synthase epsilon subunit
LHKQGRSFYTYIMANQKDTPTAAASKEKSTSMHVKIHAPFKVYYDGEATSISAINDTGPFDVLPQHHHFMTLLNTGDVVVRNNSEEEKISIQQGIMHVKKDEVIVFLDV